MLGSELGMVPCSCEVARLARSLLDDQCDAPELVRVELAPKPPLVPLLRGLELALSHEHHRSRPMYRHGTSGNRDLIVRRPFQRANGRRRSVTRSLGRPTI